jgi:hypothetical protein
MIRLVGSDGLWRLSVPPSETILRLAVARRAILNFKVRQLGLLELFVLFWSHLYRSPEIPSAHAAATAKKKKKGTLSYSVLYHRPGTKTNRAASPGCCCFVSCLGIRSVSHRRGTSVRFPPPMAH